MSKFSYGYNRKGSRKKNKRIIKATERMLELVPTSEICIVEDNKKYFIHIYKSVQYNGEENPIQVKMGDDVLETLEILKHKVIEVFRLKESAVVEWIGLLSDQLVESEKNVDDEYGYGDSQRDKTHPILIQKYSVGVSLAEAILIEGNKPRFLQIEYIDGKPKAKLSEEIILDEKTKLHPPDKLSYLNKEYYFSTKAEINDYIERASSETLDTLYNKVKSIFKKYADRDDFHIIICSADIIFTYFQDKIGMTHYLLFVGDNGVGKTGDLTVIQQLAYRALCDLSITSANIYRFLGNVEEGQGVVLEDEIDGLEDEKEKKKIYQGGYIGGKRVTRSDETPSGRKAQGFWTYCFKAFTAEKQPDSSKAKAFNERTFVLKCSPGTPTYDISDPAGDEDFKAQLDELVDVRKLLLIYRLLHYDKAIPNIELPIKNRDKQLCKPLLRLFKGTSAIEEIKKSLSRLLKEKRERKSITIEAILHGAVNSLAQAEVKKEQDKGIKSLDQSVVLEFSIIWGQFIIDVGGEISTKHPKSVETSEYGTISQQTISSILRDRFGGEEGQKG